MGGFIQPIVSLWLVKAFCTLNKPCNLVTYTMAQNNHEDGSKHNVFIIVYKNKGYGTALYCKPYNPIMCYKSNLKLTTSNFPWSLNISTHS